MKAVDDPDVLNEAKPEKHLKRSYSFYKRTCNRFVPEKPSSDKCRCGLIQINHREEALNQTRSNEVTWDAIRDTVGEPTDAYGKIEFSGAGQISRGKFIRLAHDSDAAAVLEFMINKWKLKLPKLLISVTGGAKNFILHPKLKQVLRQGLLKAARTTGAWIFTGGTNTGVMKHVGEAVRGQTVTSFPAMNDSEQLKLVGIATWGIVEHREILVGKKDTVTYRMTSSMASGNACLDNNHTHFILVDNGTNGKYEGEIAFRASLEKVISKKKISEDKPYGIPVVLLVIEGGPNTIKTVLESVTGDPPVPVVITEGSGRGADIICLAHRIQINNKSSQIAAFRGAVELQQLREKIKQAFPRSKDEELQEIYENVMKCVENERYITIFRINEEGVDIDIAILRALLKAKQASPADQLSLALVWNRVDIAISEIFVDNQKWQIEELESAMLDALSNDRVEFVRLLQENKVSMEYFLTKGRLLELYKKRSTCKASVAFRQIIGEDKLRDSGLTLEHINKMINGMLGGVRKEKYAVMTGLKKSTIGMLKLSGRENVDAIDLYQNPFDELLLWAVLCNMQKMALFMWEQGDNNLARALIAARMYMQMARKMENKNLRNDVYEEVIAHAQEFKDVALALLDECYRANELAAQKLLTYHLEDWCGLTCLSLAVDLKHEEFVAHAVCQSLLSEMWMGTVGNVSMWKILLGIIVPPTIRCLAFKTEKELALLPVTQEEHQYDTQEDSDSSGLGIESEEVTSTSEINNTRATCHRTSVRLRSDKYTKTFSNQIPWWEWKFFKFHRAPVTKFCFNVMAYMVFLMVFSAVILVDERERGYTLEVILIVFFFSLFVEELRQIIESDASAADNKLKIWASSKWNICDGIAVLLFFVGMGLRFHSSTAHIGHVVYSLDIMLWIIRLLDIFSVSKHLGPYVVMIGRMTIDMLYFLVVMVVFLLAYGVAQQAILFPKQKPTWNIISMILFRPYFQVYGELFITDPLHVDNATTEFSTPKNNEYSGTITTIILAFYLLVANILLLNLLIAIFNHIFSEVRAHSNQIWKFQRYWLIMEYAQRPPLAVPPFNIPYHVWQLFMWLWNRICCCCNKSPRKHQCLPDNRLKLFLEKKPLEELMMIEEHCLYCYLHKKETLFHASSEERVRVIGNRVESIKSQLEEMAKELCNTRNTTLNTVVSTWSPKPTRRPESRVYEKPRDDYTGHVSARRSPYPMSNVERFILSDDQVKWKVLVPDYEPPTYTADNIVHGTPSADPDIQSGSSGGVKLSFNEFDGNINRQSYVGIYDVIKGLPRNPMGRTGLAGRGLLEHWGPNHVDHHVITRWRKIGGVGAKVQDEERVLEFVAVKSRDSHHWTMPETKSTVDKSFSTAFKKTFCEGISSRSDETKSEKEMRLEKFFLEPGLKVFRGYLDDERNTDNAWVETMVTNYHDETGEILGNLEITAQSGAHCMTWLVVSSQLNLPENQVKLLKKVAKLHKQGEASSAQNYSKSEWL